MSTSTIPAVLSGLVDALVLRAGLSGVVVLSAVGGDTRTVDTIELGLEVDITEAPFTMGGSRLEEYDISGVVAAVRPGAGETVIRTARLRAFALFAEVESYLNDNPTIGALCLDTDIVSGKLRQGYGPDGRHAELEFKVHVKAIINP